MNEVAEAVVPNFTYRMAVESLWMDAPLRLVLDDSNVVLTLVSLTLDSVAVAAVAERLTCIPSVSPRWRSHVRPL